ncbi:MAG: BrnA antitoxin family protein [Terriglobia bacterium]
MPYVRGIPPAPIKAQISFRIDADVPAWLKSKGEGHLSRVNTILREHMMAEGKRGG